VKSHVLKALVEHTEDEQQRNKLVEMSTINDVGLAEYNIFIHRSRRGIVDVLEYFPSCKPPIDLLLELLPRLQPRYYSISSSSKVDNAKVAITAIVTQYHIESRLINGVCTTYLAKKDAGETVPVFIRKSTMRLPHRPSTPVIMIGPGTGFAPFRGFLQERSWHKQQGKEHGEMVLFYGCRHPDHDFIYKDELDGYMKDGVLTHLHTAFSRFQVQKVYVQDRLWDERQHVWELVQKGAYIFVCGDARNMARDVQNKFLEIFREVGSLDGAGAEKLLKELEKQRRYQADVWS